MCGRARDFKFSRVITRAPRLTVRGSIVLDAPGEKEEIVGMVFAAAAAAAA